MTTITIHIPDTELSILQDISTLVKNAGGEMEVYSDGDLSADEFKLLQESYKEALLIKKGKIKAIPASELWNE